MAALTLLITVSCKPVLPTGNHLVIPNPNKISYSGHAGAMLQAKQLGDELVIGVHSDEEILHNKGPTVMTLDERYVPALM